MISDQRPLGECIGSARFQTALQGQFAPLGSHNLVPGKVQPRACFIELLEQGTGASLQGRFAIATVNVVPGAENRPAALRCAEQEAATAADRVIHVSTSSLHS